jgi:hypothetical protein
MLAATVLAVTITAVILRRSRGPARDATRVLDTALGLR